jgi:hypothetical protein
MAELGFREQTLIDSRLDRNDGTDEARRKQSFDRCIRPGYQYQLVQRLLLERKDDGAIEIKEHGPV